MIKLKAKVKASLSRSFRRSNLCTLCESLLDEVEQQGDGISDLHGPGNDVEIALNTACILCSTYPQLIKAFCAGKVSHKRDQRLAVDELSYYVPPRKYRECLDTEAERDDDDRFSLDDEDRENIGLVSESMDDYVRGRKARFSGSTGDESVLALARHWLSRCLQEHKSCPTNPQPETTPRRLLEIKKDKAYLRDSRQAQPGGPYATLSYCWGERPFSVLTTDTVDQFRSGMNIADFLPTFRDAMIAVRQLHIKYIWIDCYCIDQSDRMDVQHEVARMGAIYSNAILDIGADGASSPYDGCFVSGLRLADETATQLYSRTNPTTRPFSARTLDMHDERWWFNEFNSTFKRAWCFQERILCPRMLHFGKYDTYWECGECFLATPNWPNGVPSMDATYASFRPFSILQLPVAHHVTGYRAHNERWATLVENYTSMTLSRPEQDKLTAIGGIAEILAGLLNDEYIAGFFRRSLVSQLSWRHHEYKKRTVWMAPSWSWASIDGKVKLRVELYPKTFAQILDIQLDFADPSNKFGRLLSGSLTLRGWLLEVVRCEYDWLLRWGSHSLQVRFDHLQTCSSLVVFLTQYGDHSSMSKSDRSRYISGGSGLVLERVDDGTFTRFGAFHDAGLSKEVYDGFMGSEGTVKII